MEIFRSDHFEQPMTFVQMASICPKHLLRLADVLVAASGKDRGYSDSQIYPDRSSLHKDFLPGRRYDPHEPNDGLTFHGRKTPSSEAIVPLLQPLLHSIIIMETSAKKPKNTE